jgi:hypothetical protein
MATRNGQVGHPRNELRGRPIRDKNRRNGRKYAKAGEHVMRKRWNQMQRMLRMQEETAKRNKEIKKKRRGVGIQDE